MSRFIHAVVLAAFLGWIPMAGAAPPGAEDGRHPGKGAGAERQEQQDKKARKTKKQRKVHDRFHADDRVIVRDYYVRNPSHLPPGLAKRGGNLPPGLAKRGGNLPPGLSRGQRLTPELEAHLLPLPRELEIRLPPPPHEVIRRIVGRDLVLMHERTREVIDVLRDALPPPPR